MRDQRISHKVRRYIARLTIIFFVLAFAASVSLLDSQGTGIVTTDNTDAKSLVTTLLKPGGGITTSNETLIFGTGPFGEGPSSGTFTGGAGILGFESGIILSSGAVADAPGPNESDGIGVDIGTPGDPDLDLLVYPDYTYNATVLEFDFEVEPQFDKVIFRYVFSSEEYNEWVCSPFNDVFAFFVNGVNFALIPGTAIPVAINNVNMGNPDTNEFDPCPPMYSEYFINNDPSYFSPDPPPIDIEPDGLTVVLEFEAPIIKGQTNHIKLAIADTSDPVWDSWVFIEAESFMGSISDKAPLDIKPGSCPNSLNVDSKGVFPVAILGTPYFDVSEINVESIRLFNNGPAVAPIRSDYEDVATPHYPSDDPDPDRNDCTEEGPDGYIDLTLKFDTQQLVQTLEAWLGHELQDGEVVKVPIMFEMMNGDPYSAEDVVWIKKKKKKK